MFVKPSWQVATTLAARSPDVAEATPKGGATVVISGGSQGVGRATALKFAQAGQVKSSREGWGLVM